VSGTSVPVLVNFSSSNLRVPKVVSVVVSGTKLGCLVLMMMAPVVVFLPAACLAGARDLHGIDVILRQPGKADVGVEHIVDDQPDVAFRAVRAARNAGDAAQPVGAGARIGDSRREARHALHKVLPGLDMFAIGGLLADGGNRQRHVLRLFGAVARGDRHFPRLRPKQGPPELRAPPAPGLAQGRGLSRSGRRWLGRSLLRLGGGKSADRRQRDHAAEQGDGKRSHVG